MKSPSIVAVCLCAALNASAVSTSMYVQDGLIACWDGIENAGVGTHDAGATVWKDIKGGYEFSLTGVTVNDDRMTFAGTATSYGTLDKAGSTATFNAAKNGTMEIVFASCSTSTAATVMLQSTSSDGLAFGFLSGVILSSTVSGSSKFPFTLNTVTNSVAIRYSSSKPVSPIYTNGWSLAATSGSDSWGSPDGSKTYIGRRASSAVAAFSGSVYCIRLYSRQLTEAEIAANYEVDRLRFDVEFRNSALQVSSAPGSLGSPSPAFGVTTGLSAGDTREVACGATVCTNANRSFEYHCAGWKLYNQSDAVVASGSETSFTYTHPTPAEFRRLEWQWVVSKDLTGDWSYNDENIAVDDGSVSRIKIDGRYVYVFTNVESALTIKVKRELALVDCLLVGGGGGGGVSGGGGGAGGVLSPGIEAKLAAGDMFGFTVGAGGAGAPEGGSSSNGGDTTLTIGGVTYTAFGGGGGGGGSSSTGKNGGSGGGGFYTGAGGSGVEGQGHAGGSDSVRKSAGGGGGAGHAGYVTDEMDGDVNKSRCGGDGIASSITGVEVYYGGGGGGRDGGLGGLGGGGNGNPVANVKANGEDGTDGLGGGGGASFSSSGNPRTGGRGGNGTEILVFTPKPQGLLIYVR